MDNENVNAENDTPQLTFTDLVYVSEIARSQEERIESFCTVLRDASKLEKIGHAILIFECEIDGKARIGYLSNVELQELEGKSGLLRAEELVALMQMVLAQGGLPKLEIGAEAGLKASREIWAAAEKESKND